MEKINKILGTIAIVSAITSTVWLSLNGFERYNGKHRWVTESGDPEQSNGIDGVVWNVDNAEACSKQCMSRIEHCDAWSFNPESIGDNCWAYTNVSYRENSKISGYLSAEICKLSNITACFSQTPKLKSP